MNKIFKITGLLIAGLLMTANVSAYYLDGGEIREGSSTDPGSFVTGGTTGASYLGHMGNVHLGLPESIRGVGNYPDIGTDYEYTGGDLTDAGNYTTQLVQNLDSSGSNTEYWYQFSSTPTAFNTLSAYYEWGVNITSFVVDFFYEGDDTDTSYYTAVFDSTFLASNGHHYDDYFAGFDEGDWLMRIQGEGVEPNNGFVVQIYPQAVPLPPAAILFISALAGFGIIGRKKKQKTTG